MAVELVYQPWVDDPEPSTYRSDTSDQEAVLWGGTYSLSQFDNSGDAGGIFGGVKPPSWPAGYLAGLMHQVTGGTDYTADRAGADVPSPSGDGYQELPALAWATQILSYPSDPDMIGFFYSYTWMAKLWHTAHNVILPNALKYRDAYAARLMAANPGVSGVEWANNSPGSWSDYALTSREQLWASNRNEGRAGALHDAPALSGTAYFLDVTPNEFGNDHDPRTARLSDAGSGNIYLGSTPALPGETAEQDARFPLDAATLEATALSNDDGVIATFYLAPSGPAFDATAWDYTTGQNVGVHQTVLVSLALTAIYHPPPYRLYTYVTITDQPPWLRALQRTDGLGAGGPPRAVQQATRNDSLRSGTGII